MTRKDYILIARIIKDNTILNDDKPIIKKNALISALCVIFKIDNKLFDSRKFRSACITTYYDNSSNGKVD